RQGPLVLVVTKCLARDWSTLDQPGELPPGLLATRIGLLLLVPAPLVEFRRVDALEPDASGTFLEGVAIDRFHGCRGVGRPNAIGCIEYCTRKDEHQDKIDGYAPQ